MRRLGVILAALVLASGTAAADKKQPAGKTEKQPGKAKGKGKAKAAEQPPAEDPAPEPPAAPAWWAELPHVEGPKVVDLGSQIELDLPAGFVLFERAQAQDMMRKGGDDPRDVLAAVIKPDSEWLVVIEYTDIGYVTDSDADQLNPGELLESYRQGTAVQNIKRKELNVAELLIDGWNEMPRYDRAQRHLVWGLDAHTVEGPVVNYFTRVLGRGGFISLNLIDAPATLAKSKGESAGLLANLRFRPGARYEDYREGDKSSGWGLTALVLGGAGLATAKAAKAGILITILLGLKKGLVFIAVGIAGFFKWLFGRKKVEAPAAPPDEPPPTT